jgi:tetratricopeptide (TPR) repeat protein
MSSVNAITFISGNLPDYLPKLNTWPDPQEVARVMGITKGQFLPAVRATLDAHESVTQYLSLLAKKLLALWSWYEMPNNANFYYYRLYASQLRYLPVTFAIVAPLSIVGMGLAIRQLGACGPLFMLAGTHLAAMLITLVQSRYRAPLAVALMPFAALALVRLGQYLSEKRFVSAAVLGLTGVLLGAWILRPLPDELPLVRVADYAPLTKWHYREKGYNGTRTYLETVLSVEPDRYETMVLLADLELTEKHFNQALSYSKNALRIAPDHTKAIMQMGVSYYGLQQYDLAGQAFKKLIHLDPTSSQPYVNLLAVYLKQNNHVDGQPLAEGAIRRFPNNERIQEYAARILKMSPGQKSEP